MSSWTRIVANDRKRMHLDVATSTDNDDEIAVDVESPLDEVTITVWLNKEATNKLITALTMALSKPSDWDYEDDTDGD